ncbi:FHA domain-containing protein [Colletotrichum scovillei]|uniref:FHA domain-containing protein n=1 Tax=Colletotrichum scovillei TaxID=1209932 RepID=A0A9P7RD44_9PEZI|nr:FHA domain-containing protein [Colletotrichum scovillei]KAF4785934.1 FHA domain-containing protein [Colletotrichum scovillei]KAG7055290.1 FHA domain-containing protein [Colletotrichum scovillei]KAG7074701.1 FHA domain-containing protein [Colletotrichum scovillei]KAG7081786.1 FHA domain-containing protein [Colletotrichum scovillei]
MATGVKPQAEDVLLTVSVQYPNPEFQFPERRVVLEQKHPSVVNIGRTSKRFSNLEAKPENCYFDSPVMSREHAKITVDWYHKKLFVKDIGSLHGTYHNSLKLPPHTAKELTRGDIVKFGIDIQRSNDLFPPCTIQVDWEFDHLAKAKASELSGRPTFSVPDDSDSESSEEDMSTTDDIRATVEKIRKIEMPKSTTGLAGSFPSFIPPGVEPIVIDEDIQKDTDKPSERAPNATQDQEVTIELDAPYDEEEDEDMPSSHRMNSNLPLVFASESESEDSYDDDESESYPDDEPSSQGMPDSYDDDICLSDSEISDRSDDSEAQSTFESESESEDENLTGAPSYDEPENGQTMNGDYGSQPNKDMAAAWEAQDPSLTFTQSQQMLSMPHASYFPQPDAGRQFFPAPMPSLPSIIPYVGLQEQGRQNDLRLPSILNPLDDHVENPFLADMNPEQMHTSAPTDYLLQSEGTAPLRASWDRVPNTPKVFTATESLAFSQDDGISAEALGKVSGKPEFFAAREENKQILRRNEQDNDTIPDQPRSQVPEQPATSTEPSTSKLGHHITSDAATASEPVNETPKSAKVAESAWSSSGEKFLNSPQDFPLTYATETPELDMTSAFSFQQSKLSIITPSEDVSRNVPAVEKATPKRKASEISTLTPHEETTEAAVKSAETGAQTTAEQPMVVSVVTEPTPEAPPPPKRLRSFLSKAGYFVGGGVLTAAGVVTALAATAPAL